MPQGGRLHSLRPASVANADGYTTIPCGSILPSGIQDGHWISTVPGKGYFVCLRLYIPRDPFFSKEGRPSESEWVQ